jgi:glutaconate CoA-transferase subunit A
VASVERLVPTEEVAAAGITVPGHLVTAVTGVPFGAHPASCYPDYAYDRRHLHEYVTAVGGGRDGLAAYLDRYVRTADGEAGYRAAVGADRLAELTGWNRSLARWQEVFA